MRRLHTVVLATAVCGLLSCSGEPPVKVVQPPAPVPLIGTWNGAGSPASDRTITVRITVLQLGKEFGGGCGGSATFTQTGSSPGTTNYTCVNAWSPRTDSVAIAIGGAGSHLNAFFDGHTTSGDSILVGILHGNSLPLIPFTLRRAPAASPSQRPAPPQ